MRVDLKDKVVIVTGGGGAIGGAMAEEFAANGAKVGVTGRTKATLQAVVDAIRSRGGEASAVIADVGSRESAAAMIEETVRLYGRLDVLVNNAGITNNCNWVDIKREAYEQVIATNLMSFLHMSHLVLPYMVNHSDKEHQCIICNTSSVGGMTGVINQADYCAAKAGVIGLTRALALELAPKGIRVNALAPGMIMTDMLRGVNQDELKALAATIPQGYIGDVSDIAGAMEYIFTAPYLTGQVISPNGGFVLQ